MTMWIKVCIEVVLSYASKIICIVCYYIIYIISSVPPVFTMSTICASEKIHTAV